MEKYLDKYRAKRSADRTPEPFGATAPRPRLFVVQKHAARRLHFDFRLEWGGVLLSWAVPKGPSPDPAEKRLAVHVEDHPVDYADFEGVIPEGNYGAGTVIVWDQGRWTPIGDVDEGLAKGKLEFVLDGYKLRGEWTLVRTKRGAGGKEASKDWLLIKHRDVYVSTSAEAAFDQASIFSGLTLEELRDAGDRATALRREIETLGAPRKFVQASDVELMLAETREKPFSRPGWIFELKYDGFRAISAKENGPKIFYRRGLDATAIYPELARSLTALPFEHVVLDGEITVLDERGHPSFQLLQKRALLTRSADIARAAVELPATFFAFDLLGVDDFDLRSLPLLTRKALLKKVVPRSGALRFADHVETRGEALFEQILARGLEGIVAKKSDSPYRRGRSPDWCKVRVDRTGDFVIVGFTRPKGSRGGFGALQLGVFDKGQLVYAGRVGSGFSEKVLAELSTRLALLARADPPCIGKSPREQGLSWVEPLLCVEVRYKEWTRDGNLRQPAFLRMRDDKKPEECVRERDGDESPTLTLPRKGGGEKSFPFSNLDKMYWPVDGYTKGDLIAYYKVISPWILPYLRDRPLVLTRYPDGIDGKSFFQKDAPAFVPDWIRTERIWSEQAQREIDYFLCDDAESLLYIANMGTIPFHVWASRVKAPERPDWCILDLDPKEAPFAHVVQVARALKKLCDEIEVASFVKTSGQAGLHVLIPLGGQCTHEQSKWLAQVIAHAVERELPKISTTVRLPAKRGGRVYLDFLQNGHGKTIAAPFCVRPKPGAPVSTPLLWSEVNGRLDPRRFTMKTVPARVEKKGDPMLPVLKAKSDLARALGRLRERFPT